MSAYSPRPEDFAPLGAQGTPVLVRPSLSYWADARARLLRNPRALGSLVLLAARHSLPPSARCSGPWTRPRRTSTTSPSPRIWAPRALLIDRSQRWPGIEAEGWPAAPDPFWLQSPTRAALPAPEGLEVIGTPHT